MRELGTSAVEPHWILLCVLGTSAVEPHWFCCGIRLILGTSAVEPHCFFSVGYSSVVE